MSKANSKKAALFLDRDGVLIHDSGYVFRPEDLTVLTGVATSLRRALEQGYLLLVVTNQSGVARGYFTMDEVHRFHRALDEELWQSAQVKIDGYYICPHHPQGTVAEYTKECHCRKPGSGLVEQAMADFDIDLSRSFMIGDKASDVECGIRLGIPALQIDQGQYPAHPNPWKVVSHLAEAIEIILKETTASCDIEG